MSTTVDKVLNDKGRYENRTRIMTGHYAPAAAPVAADADRIVTSVNLTNVALTIAAQPDVPRPLTATIVDTTESIVAGFITFIGVDASGRTITEVIDASAGAGVYTTSNAFASITSITTSGFTVLGGSGDETITVGVNATLGLPFDGTNFEVYLTHEDQVVATAPTVDSVYGVVTPDSAPDASVQYEFWVRYTPR